MGGCGLSAGLKTINIVVALACEAKPIIDHYRLSPVSAKPFSCYSGTIDEDFELRVNVLVSGIGSLNMASALGWLAAKINNTQSAWLNIGIGGHATLGVGEIVRVHQSVDLVSGQSIYLPLVAKWAGETSTLLTHNSVVTEYPKDAVVDMEGAAFVKVASKFNSMELVQSLKVISDNQEHGVERLNAAVITQLINDNIDAIKHFIAALMDLQSPQLDLSAYESLIASLHCTVSQRQQFLQLLVKLSAVSDLDKTTLPLIKEANSMKQLLQQLTQQLNNAEPVLAKLHG